MIPITKVIKETEYNYIIKCPYCDKNHYHGKMEGERVSHCYVSLRNKKLKKQIEERNKLYNSNQYLIKK